MTVVEVGARDRGGERFHWAYFPEKEFAFYRIGSPSEVNPRLAPPGVRSFAVEFAHQGASDHARLTEQALSPPRLPELAALGLDEELGNYLENTGSVIRVAADLFMLPVAVAEAQGRLERHLREQGSTTVATARDVLGSSRRTVVPLLEYFDTTHVTRRDGDLRFAGAEVTPRPGP